VIDLDTDGITTPDRMEIINQAQNNELLREMKSINAKLEKLLKIQEESELEREQEKKQKEEQRPALESEPWPVRATYLLYTTNQHNIEVARDKNHIKKWTGDDIQIYDINDVGEYPNLTRAVREEEERRGILKAKRALYDFEMKNNIMRGFLGADGTPEVRRKYLELERQIAKARHNEPVDEDEDTKKLFEMVKAEVQTEMGKRPKPRFQVKKSDWDKHMKKMRSEIRIRMRAEIKRRG
jgi:hypothetical protein